MIGIVLLASCGPPPLAFPKPAIIRPAEPALWRASGPTRGTDLLRQSSVSSLAMPFMPGFMYAPRPSFSLAYRDFEQKSNIAASSTTFTDKAIGAALATRLVICAIHWSISGTTTLSSATIGGVTATIVAQCNGTNGGVAIIQAVVPTGTTASVAVTFGASVVACGCGVWSLIGQVSNSAYDFDNPAGGGDTTRTATLDVPAGGAVVGATIGSNSLGTWTNASERYDQVSASTARHSGADDSTATLLTGRAISSTQSRAICAASWR